jgi:C4-dicarboxylate-specific signal transduction histidine kinase
MLRHVLPLLALAWLGTACKSKPPVEEPTAELDNARTAKVADELDQALVRGVVACRTLSNNADVRAFFGERARPHKVLTVLRDTVTKSAADHAYLLDGQGVVIAATEAEKVGYDFSHWAFFESARQGKVLVFPAIGFVSERRGLFIVVPGKTAGAVVLRLGTGPLDRALERLSEPSAVVYRDRYVLATNRRAWGFNGLRGADERGATLDLEDPGLQDMLDHVVPPIGPTVEVDGVVYDVHRLPMVVEEWQLLVCVEQPPRRAANDTQVSAR